MGYLKKLSVAAGAALFSSAAFAQATSDMRITVIEQSPNVTYAADGSPKAGKIPAQPALVTYTSYLVTVSNSGTTSSNTVNNITFRAATRIASQDVPVVAGRTAPYQSPAVPVLGTVSCSLATPPSDWSYNSEPTPISYTPSSDSYIECPIGQLKAGTSKSFYVYFLAPKAPTTLVTEQIQFDWRLNYGEATNDSGGASRQDSQQASAAPVLLGTFNPSSVKSSVPPTKKVELFTGTFGIATNYLTGDGWTTTITVPSANATNAKATIDESKASCSFGTTVLCAVYSDISVKDGDGNTVVFPATNANAATNALIIKLRRDASTIPSGSRLRDAAVYYAPDSIANPLPIPDCAVAPLGTTVSGVEVKRCEVKSARIEYKNANAPTPDYVGDWEFTIWATENGKYGW